MNIKLKKFLHFITIPYRAGRDFVDTRPSIERVREHLRQMELVTAPASHPDMVAIKVRLVNTQIPLEPVMVASSDQADSKLIPLTVNRESAEDLISGFNLCREMVNDARISSLKRQTRAIKADQKRQRNEEKAYQAARAEEEAETHVLHPLTVGPEGAV